MQETVTLFSLMGLQMFQYPKNRKQFQTKRSRTKKQPRVTLVIRIISALPRSMKGNSSKTKRKSYEENSAQIGKGGINCPVDGRSKTKSSKTVKVSSTQKSTREVDEKSRGNQNDQGTYQTNMPNLKKKLTSANKNSIKVPQRNITGSA